MLSILLVKLLIVKQRRGENEMREFNKSEQRMTMKAVDVAGSCSEQGGRRAVSHNNACQYLCP